MSESTLIEVRKAAFLRELLKLRRGEAMPLKDLVASAGFRYVEKGSGSSELDLSERQVKSTLDELEESVYPLIISYPKQSVLLSFGPHTPFEMRTRRSSRAKKAIASVLLDRLFGYGWRGNVVPPEKFEVAFSISASALDSKVSALRKRHQMYFAVDGGTTTLEIIKEMLTAEQIPFPVNFDDAGNETSDPRNVRLIEPVLLTNSFPIVQEINQCVAHRYSLHVEFSGGISRPARNCTTGDLAKFEERASKGILNLVIVGATGVFLGADKIPRAACDDMEEALIKGAMLRMGDAQEHIAQGLRVLAFHSEKLRYPEARALFCAITARVVDLLVMDSGDTEEDQQQIRNFLPYAEKTGVSVLIAQNPEGPKWQTLAATSD